MMRISVEDIENSKMWSFATAALKVLSYPVPAGDLHGRKRDFIKRIQQKLFSAKRAVSEILKFQNMHQHAVSNIHIAEHAEQYRLAHEVAYLKACELIDMVDVELKRYFDDELHFDEAEDKSFQTEKYIALLHDLQTCCLGIINNNYTAHSYSCKTEEERYNYFYALLDCTIKNAVILYDFAAASGGSYVPAFQDMDPLIGSTSTDEVKYGYDLGQCYGHTFSWGRQISDRGSATKLNLMDEFTFQAQLYQVKSEPVEIKTSRLAAETLLDQITFEYIYKVAVYSDKSAHAMGIRRIPGTTKIEFFDPNFGLFVLPNTNAFVDFFQLYMSVLCLNNKKVYERITLSAMFDQDMNVMPDSAKPAAKMNIMTAHTTFLAYMELFDTMQNKYRDQYFANINTADLKRAFVDQMLVRIKYTFNRDVLQKLYDVLTQPVAVFDGPGYEKYRFVKVLHGKVNPKLDKLRFWASDETTSMSVLKAALLSRMEELKPQVSSRAQRGTSQMVRGDI